MSISYNTLLEKVYKPVFLSKLAAEYNVKPTTETDVQNLLDIAKIMRHLKETQGKDVEQAVASNPWITKAADGLKTITRSSLGSNLLTSKEKDIYKEAEDLINNNPEILLSALNLLVEDLNTVMQQQS
ncbi:MAG: hypothetical protein QXH92_04170 [Candidatus Aenigmatarchaeota archaeon]